MVNETSERAFNYIKEHKDDVFEAIVLLAGTNDTELKSTSTSTDSIAQDLFIYLFMQPKTCLARIMLSVCLYVRFSQVR